MEYTDFFKNEMVGGKGYNGETGYKSDENFDQNELNMGIKVEFEHTEDAELSKQIAKDHLTEDPKYYTKLKAAGLADELEKKKQQDEMASMFENKELKSSDIGQYSEPSDAPNTDGYKTDPRPDVEIDEELKSSEIGSGIGSNNNMQDSQNRLKSSDIGQGKTPQMAAGDGVQVTNSNTLSEIMGEKEIEDLQNKWEGKPATTGNVSGIVTAIGILPGGRVMANIDVGGGNIETVDIKHLQEPIKEDEGCCSLVKIVGGINKSNGTMPQAGRSKNNFASMNKTPSNNHGGKIENTPTDIPSKEEADEKAKDTAARPNSKGHIGDEESDQAEPTVGMIKLASLLGPKIPMMESIDEGGSTITEPAAGITSDQHGKRWSIDAYDVHSKKGATPKLKEGTPTDFEEGIKKYELNSVGVKRKTTKEMTFKKSEIPTTVPVGTQIELHFSKKHPQAVMFYYEGKWRILYVSSLWKYVPGMSKPPSIQSLERMSDNGVATTVTGKRTEPDGFGDDGSPSWMLVAGII